MKNLAIIFEFFPNWAGGNYYFRNLILALKMLPIQDRPTITLLCENVETVRFIVDIGYPNLYWIKNQQFEERPDAFPFDVIFPHPISGQAARTISWIPDFQEMHLPYYFSQDEMVNRRHHHRLRFGTAGLVVSSMDVSSDVSEFYPGECPNIAVVHFATFDDFDKSRLSDTKKKYDLETRYVMCPNQIWVHKNHIVVLKAVHLLKLRNVDITVCFTGSESDYRVGNYANTLKDIAEDWELGDAVRFLGFIPREDQLVLMFGADYIIQPSLFEGWSTVIEDAKAMGQFVVASDLRIHSEQVEANGTLFPRHDASALADIMSAYIENPPKISKITDYNAARSQFGKDFIDACNRFIPTYEAASILSMADVIKMSKDNMETYDIPQEMVTTADIIGLQAGDILKGGHSFSNPNVRLVGFSSLENEGVWTVSVISSLEVSLFAQFQGDVIFVLSLTAFNYSDQERWIEVAVSGGTSNRVGVVGWQDFQLELRASSNGGKYKTIMLRTNTLVQFPPDPRTLGLRLNGLSVDER